MQNNWTDKFMGIWGIFHQTIDTHFGTVSPLPLFSIIPSLFLQKNFISAYQIFICDWDLNLGRKELGI